MLCQGVYNESQWSVRVPGNLPDPIRLYIDAYNAKDVDGMLQCVADHIAFRNTSIGQVDITANTKPDFRHLAEAALPLFIWRKQDVTNHISVAETTLVEIDYEALLAADLPNGLKAGQILRLKGRSLFDIKAGRIARIIDES